MRKPEDYDDRRRWQDEFRARGEAVPCGRNACENMVATPYVNTHTPLLYCADCAALINFYNPGLCTPEASAT